MRERLRKRRTRRAAAVQFCDSCGSVCDAACRSEAAREAPRQQALVYGMLR
jgi:hypothetical protein